MKYIDAEKLKELIDEKWKELADKNVKIGGGKWDAEISTYLSVLRLIDSLQHEQPNDACAEIKEYYGEEPAFEDERTKAAYHFFSAGKAFELREYEEERGKHITDLLDNFQKGMNAGYEKAISELKEGKVECSPIMKELIDKLFNIGNVFNFGFGPKTIQQEQPDFPTTDEQTKEFLATHPKIKVPEKYKDSDWLFKKQEQPEVELEKEIDSFFPESYFETAINFDDAVDIARHFCEFGFRRAKEMYGEIENNRQREEESK